MSRRELTPEGYAAVALEVATSAAALLMGGYRKRPAPTQKAKHDLVTEYDLASEKLVREKLGALTPSVGIVAEEGGGEVQALSWFCDPLDGTTNFVHGHPFWCVSIGLLEEGTPVAGAVVAPALGLTYVGYAGGPALRSGEPCHVSDNAELEDALCATGFPPDRQQAPGNNLDTFVRVQKAARGVRRCGSAALDMCLVADGTYDAYWERRLYAWDLAAGAALVLAAGGTITALDGGPANLHVGHVIASNGRVHQALQAVIAATA